MPTESHADYVAVVPSLREGLARGGLVQDAPIGAVQAVAAAYPAGQALEAMAGRHQTQHDFSAEAAPLHLSRKHDGATGCVSRLWTSLHPSQSFSFSQVHRKIPAWPAWTGLAVSD